MPLDKPPEPFNGDYYIAGRDEAIRGTTVHDSRPLDAMVGDTPVDVKIPHSFTSGCSAITLPTDPMYVMPRSRFAVRSTGDVSSLANLVLSGLQRLCPTSAEVAADISRMRISVLIPGTVEFKVKFFVDPQQSKTIVAIRRDSGDWFIFIQIYSSIKKFLRLNGVDIEAVGGF